MKNRYWFKNNHQLNKTYKSVTTFSLNKADFPTLTPQSSSKFLIVSVSRPINLFIIVSATKRRRDIKIPLCLYIVSNDYGRTHKCDFSIFDQKFPFWANLVKKIKIVSLSWNLVSRLIRICRNQWWSWFFPFFTGNTLFGQIWSWNS